MAYCWSDAVCCSPASLQVPAVRITRDTALTETKSLQRSATQKTLDALIKYPEIALETWGKVEKALVAQKLLATEDLDSWNSQYKKLHRLPTFWMASRITMEGSVNTASLQ